MNTNNNERIWRVAMPVVQMEGFRSEVSQHFGKAPGFLVVNSDGGSLVHLVSEEVRSNGECAPIEALVSSGAQIVLVHGMGEGALQRCRANGLRVIEAKGFSVLDVLSAFNKGYCGEFGEESLCHHNEEHHNGSGGCCH